MRVLNTFAERKDAGVPEMPVSTNAEMSLSVKLKEHPQLKNLALKKAIEGSNAEQILKYLGLCGHFGHFWIQKWHSHRADSTYSGEYFQTKKDMDDAFAEMKRVQSNPRIECFQYNSDTDWWSSTGDKWSNLE